MRVKLTIEACAKTKAEAIGQALTICGMAVTGPSAPAWNCGGTNGNAGGAFELIPNDTYLNPDIHSDPMSSSSSSSAAAKMDTSRATLESLVREVMEWHSDPMSADYNLCDSSPCYWCEQAAKLLEGKP